MTHRHPLWGGDVVQSGPAGDQRPGFDRKAGGILVIGFGAAAGRFHEALAAKQPDGGTDQGFDHVQDGIVTGVLPEKAIVFRATIGLANGRSAGFELDVLTGRSPCPPAISPMRRRSAATCSGGNRSRITM